MRTTFNIEDGLLEEAKVLARQRKTTLGGILNEALRVGLLRTKGQQTESAPLPLKTFRGDGLRAGVDLRDSASLLEAMEQP
jgi:hypothetical protein